MIEDGSIMKRVGFENLNSNNSTRIPNCLTTDYRLKPGPWFLYVHLLMIADGELFDVAEFCRIANIKERTYRNYKRILQDKELITKVGTARYNLKYRY